MKTVYKESRGRRHAFSLLEVLATIGILALVSTVSIVTINRQKGNLEETKLRHQLGSMNSAIQTYKMSGGQLDGVTTVDQAIAKLKAFAKQSDRGKIPGMSESLVDPRLEAVPVSAADMASDRKRIVWDTNAQRFVYGAQGAPGIGEFRIGESAGDTEDVDDRKLSTQLASEDSWIWDYTDPPEDFIEGVEGDSSTNQYADIPGDDPGQSTVATPLLPPTFSLTGGTWNFDEFGSLQLSLFNPNEASFSAVYYSVNDGGWNLYSNPISIAPNSNIKAFVQSLDPVSFADSTQHIENYAMVPLEFSGYAHGDFLDPDGSSNMEVYVSNTETSSIFRWGTSATSSMGPSELVFTGANFENILAGSMFSLGTLDYFNGTIWSGTGADSVDLSITLDLYTPEITDSFEFALELENTRNYGYNPDQDADFVRLGNLSSDFTTELNGIQYALELQFGYEGENGFATVDQFHVHEGSGATADVYGIFVEVEEEPID